MWPPSCAGLSEQATLYVCRPAAGLLARTPQLVLQRVQRRREASTAVGKHGAGVGVHRHDGRTAKQAAVLDAVAHALADGRNHADGRGLVVDDADGHLVGDDAGDGLDRGVTGDSDHVQANGAHTGHGLELLERKRTGLDGGDHAGVLGHGDKGAGETAHAGAGHDAALLDGIVEHGERAGRAGATAGRCV